MSGFRFILFSFTVFLFQDCYAQTRNEFWSKVNLNKKINSHFSASADFQYRQQDDPGKDNNMFREHLTGSIRLWIYYSLPKRWTIQFSPISFFRNKIIRENPTEISSVEELRASFGATREFIFGRITNRHRLLYELGSLQSNDLPAIFRHRYRFQTAIIVPVLTIKSDLILNYHLADEFFMRTIGHITSIDQNRLFNGLQLKSARKDLTMAYQFTVQRDGTLYVNKNQLLLALSFNL